MPIDTLPHPPSDDALRAALAQTVPNAQAAWLFGSAARDRMQPDSDIDVALALPFKPTPMQVWQWQTALAQALGFDVDVLDFHSLDTLMQVQILSTGRLLFGHDSPLLWDRVGRTYTDYQHLQDSRAGMVIDLAKRLAAA